MTREERDQLRGLAAKATPGPWEVVEYEGNSLVIHSDNANRVCFMATHGDSKKQWLAIQANADHIAAANPSVITALLDHIDRLEREARAGRELHQKLLLNGIQTEAWRRFLML